MKYFKFFIILILHFGCKHYDNPIEEVMASSNEKIKKVADSLDKYEVQIIFSEVHRDKDNKVTFTDYSFQVDDSIYFYPASTVKFPTSLLVLEKVDKDSILNRDTPFFVQEDSVETTLAKEIIKIFAVSDNDANNRLFEYMGQDYMNKAFKDKDINGRISHRLGVDYAEILTTKPLIFQINDSTLYTTTPTVNEPIVPLKIKKLQKGRGYYDGDSLIMKPKDFSYRNYLPVSSLHNIMKRFIFPELYPYDEQFHLSESDRQFILENMKIIPRKAGYDPKEYYDSYGKFFIYGDTRELIPDAIDIYNKVGYAYGYLTDCAYIVDKKKNKEWLITATIHVNDNQIFNDDKYEYDNIGIPFLAELGRQLIKF